MFEPVGGVPVGFIPEDDTLHSAKSKFYDYKSRYLSDDVGVLRQDSFHVENWSLFLMKRPYYTESVLLTPTEKTRLNHCPVL